MATSKKSKKKNTGRGSPEAIEKRKVARLLNAALTGEGKKPRLDGRTEKRRQRLIKELKDGRRGKPLKPIDVLSHTHELLEIGESIASIRKQGVKPRKTEVDDIDDLVSRTQKAYGFREEAWRMLGIRIGGGSKKSAKKAAKKPAKKKRTSKKK